MDAVGCNIDFSAMHTGHSSSSARGGRCAQHSILNEARLAGLRLEQAHILSFFGIDWMLFSWLPAAQLCCFQSKQVQSAPCAAAAQGKQVLSLG